MKVKELISALLIEDMEADVVVLGYEGGYKEPVMVEELEIVKNYYTEPWMGPHESKSTVDFYSDDSTKTSKAVLIA